MLRTFPTFFHGLRTMDMAVLARTIFEWQARAEQRHRLAELDDRMLKDIGVNRASARAEADKPFWQL